MEFYGQDTEVRLLERLIAQLDHRVLIDVGAERGEVADALLKAGTDELHAFDPHPDNVATLRTRFGEDERVAIHDCAVSDEDGDGELHTSNGPDGQPLPFGHTLLQRPDTDEIRWGGALPVTCRSLASLIDADQLPKRAGILKIDTEGNDLAVVLGMGPLKVDVVMVEHWTDLPHGLGPCPWTSEEMVSTLRIRGFTHFVCVVHRGEFVTLKWDDAEIERGVMGNLIFLHDRLVTQVLPDLLSCAGRLAEEVVQVGQMYMRAAGDRLDLIDELGETASERLKLIDQLTEAAEARLHALEAAAARIEAQEARIEAQDIEIETLRHQDG